MKFSLIDKVVCVEPNVMLSGTKSLAMGEEYLRDHFPKFPVMPGVLMIEAMAQASSWLIRISEDFAHSMVLLKEVRNVKFGQFLRPGQTLSITTRIISQTDDLVVLKSEGSIEGNSRIRAQLTMRRYNLVDFNPKLQCFDGKIISNLKDELAIIWDDYHTNE
ncbi:MAG: beta-hydroxyacyl-ACP dehydratase [Thermoguttaceae bacterium]|nr:beta-hydroxyacyl-ACP dehydratase [Thermoguttaceae bacterium]